MRWRRGDEIGDGGFCVVFECGRVEGDDVIEGYAQKRLKEEHARDKDTLARFQREVRMLAELDHPNIVPVEGRNLSDDPPWFIMPRAGGSLDEAIPDGGGGERWVDEVFEPILMAVAHAHDRGMVHRDVKPQNVLLFDQLPKVADFGLGKRLAGNTEAITTTYANLVTYAYSAPEQFSNMRDVDERADVFALGKTLVHMLTGAIPAPGPTDGADVPERYRYLVARCCANNPDDRYQDAGAALEAFRRLVAATTHSEEEPTTRLAELTEAWWEADAQDRLGILDEFHELLMANAVEEQLFVDEVPRLPEQLVDEYQDKRPNDFRAMVEAYDAHVSGGLPFDYCDVVAAFYRRMWRRTDDPQLRRMILARLLGIAHSHNRWFVGDVAAGLLTSIGEEGTAAMATEVLLDSPDDTAWLARHIGPSGARDMPFGVREALGL